MWRPGGCGGERGHSPETSHAQLSTRIKIKIGRCCRCGGRSEGLAYGTGGEAAEADILVKGGHGQRAPAHTHTEEGAGVGVGCREDEARDVGACL